MYREAQRSLEKTIKAYFDNFKVQDEQMKSRIGKAVNGKVWTEHDYTQWRLAQIGRGARYQAMRDNIAARLTNIRETAIAYTNGEIPSVYALNRNYAAYTIEQAAGDGFYADGRGDGAASTCRKPRADAVLPDQQGA